MYSYVSIWKAIDTDSNASVIADLLYIFIFIDITDMLISVIGVLILKYQKYIIKIPIYHYNDVKGSESLHVFFISALAVGWTLHRHTIYVHTLKTNDQ